jgi:hypothetical protein
VFPVGEIGKPLRYECRNARERGLIARQSEPNAPTLIEAGFAPLAGSVTDGKPDDRPSRSQARSRLMVVK